MDNKKLRNLRNRLILASILFSLALTTIWIMLFNAYRGGKHIMEKYNTVQCVDKEHPKNNCVIKVAIITSPGDTTDQDVIWDGTSKVCTGNNVSMCQETLSSSFVQIPGEWQLCDSIPDDDTKVRNGIIKEIRKYTGD